MCAAVGPVVITYDAETVCGRPWRLLHDIITTSRNDLLTPLNYSKNGRTATTPRKVGLRIVK